MKHMLLVAGAALLLQGGAQAQQDSLENVERDAGKAYEAARLRKGAVDPALMAQLVERCLDLATDLKGQPAAFDCYQSALNYAGSCDEARFIEVYTEVHEILLTDLVDDPRFAGIVLGYRYAPKALAEQARGYFEWAEREAKNDSVQCACRFVRIKEKLDASGGGAAAVKAAVAALQELNAKYGKLPGPHGYGTWAESVLDDEIDNLTIVGTPAPEIEAKDLDGVAFKLSDYRGKVVLLDFWGYW